MKYLIFLAIIVTSCGINNCFGQSQRFIYKHTYLSDSTNASSQIVDLVILDVSGFKSQFYYDKDKIKDSLSGQLNNSKKNTHLILKDFKKI